jgi:hypothetical protein
MRDNRNGILGGVMIPEEEENVCILTDTFSLTT